MTVTVFYEDDPGVQVTSFGPNMLVLACLADRLGRERYELRPLVNAVPAKGNAKLRERIKGIGQLLEHVVVVFDSDRIRELYALSAEATLVEVREAVLAETGPGVAVCLLERNMEDVVRACCRVLGIPVPTAKPTPAERGGLNFLKRSLRSAKSSTP